MCDVLKNLCPIWWFRGQQRSMDPDEAKESILLRLEGAFQYDWFAGNRLIQ